MVPEPCFEATSDKLRLFRPNSPKANNQPMLWHLHGNWFPSISMYEDSGESLLNAGMASDAKGKRGSAANLFSLKTRPPPSIAISLGPSTCSADKGCKAKNGFPPKLLKVFPWMSHKPYSTSKEES